MALIRQPGNRLVNVQTILFTSLSRSSKSLGSSFIISLASLPAGAGLEFAVNDLAVRNVRVRNDERVTNELVPLLEHRDCFGNEVLGPHLVRAPHLAAHAIPHRVFHGEEPGEEVRGATVGAGAVPCAGLTENSQVAGNRQVTGHSDLLAAGDSHAVHPADHRLLAVEDRVYHAVEQVHVLPVFMGPHGIVFGVFFGVSACAEGHVASSGEYDGHYGPVLAGCRKPGNNALDHFRGVRVVLLGVVEADPGDVKSFNFLAFR